MSERQIGNLAQLRKAQIKILTAVLAATVLCCMLALPAAAQQQPYYAPEQLDRLVSRVALYPDPLLAQVLAAATFPDQIPDAASWADEHRNLTGSQLAQSIDGDQLPWDPSVQALLPFPSVLSTMASDMDWTSDLGNAFLGQQQDVMYAVQRMRQRARDYGYLRTGPQMVVSGGPYITILPARPDYVVVPYYDPVVVYQRPRPGFFVGTAIGFRFGVALGVAFRPWGWGYNRIAWNERVVIVNNSPWHRTWVNRHEYVHPYTIRRTIVVHDDHREHEWRERREAEERREHEREAERREHERREHEREAERREHDRREYERQAHAREEHREAERREEHREAERREEHREAEHREARREERHEEHHAVQEAHRDNQQIRREVHQDNKDNKDNHPRGKSEEHRNDNHNKNDHKPEVDGHGR